MSNPPRRSDPLPTWVPAGLGVLGAVILTLTSWQWRGLIGWGLGAAGVILLIVAVGRRGSRAGQAHS